MAMDKAEGGPSVMAPYGITITTTLGAEAFSVKLTHGKAGPLSAPKILRAFAAAHARKFGAGALPASCRLDRRCDGRGGAPGPEDVRDDGCKSERERPTLFQVCASTLSVGNG